MRILPLFLIFNCIISFGQDFTDTIITKSNDTIICKITYINEYNVFYEYKKKKSIKNGYFKKNQVNYYTPKESEEIYDACEVDTFNKEKCDTCQNWVVLSTNDTVFYNLNFFFYKDDPKLIEFIIKRDNKVSFVYNSCDLNEIMYKGIHYFKVKLWDRYENFPRLRSYKIFDNCDYQIGYYKIKGKASLISSSAYSRMQYEKKRGYSYIDCNNIVFFEYSDDIIDTTKIPVNIHYDCLEMYGHTILLPKKQKLFIDAIKDFMYDDSIIIQKVEKRQYKPKDIEELVLEYNSRHK